MNEKNIENYDVCMRTPVGNRLGHMTVCTNAGRVSGYLDILNHREPFDGTIDEAGNCEVSGKIITLMRTISYDAAGTITQGGIKLFIKDDNNVLEITGTPSQV